MRAQGRETGPQERPDFGGITEGEFGIEAMPDRWHNVIDLQTAIELFTPVYQLFLTDNDFWRATNSLQLDETIAIYVARILRQPHNLVPLNNKHPMVPESTLRAGYRLVLHGLASEMLYELLVREKRGVQRPARSERAQPAEQRRGKAVGTMRHDWNVMRIQGCALHRIAALRRAHCSRRASRNVHRIPPPASCVDHCPVPTRSAR